MSIYSAKATSAEANALRAELALLNTEVDDAIAKRKTWMDAHMPDFCDFVLGGPIYDGKTGKLLGVVCELYRYWADDARYDNQMAVDIKYRMAGLENACGIHTDNTSRQTGRRFSPSPLEAIRA